MISHDQISEFLRDMVLNHDGSNPLHRNEMHPDDIKIAEKLVKGHLLTKGTAIEDGRVKIYYYEKPDRSIFDNLREIGFFSKKLE